MFTDNTMMSHIWYNQRWILVLQHITKSKNYHHSQHQTDSSVPSKKRTIHPKRPQLSILGQKSPSCLLITQMIRGSCEHIFTIPIRRHGHHLRVKTGVIDRPSRQHPFLMVEVILKDLTVFPTPSGGHRCLNSQWDWEPRRSPRLMHFLWLTGVSPLIPHLQVNSSNHFLSV